MATPAISPTAGNLLIGAGQLYLDRYTSAGVRQGLFHVGNCESLELTVNDTTIEKFSSMSKARPLYARRLQRREVQAKVQFDEISKENMAMWMMGTLSGATQAATPVVAEVLFADVPASTLGAALGNKTFKVAKYGAVTAVTVKIAAVSLTITTDYTVNLADGTITINPASTATTNGTDDLVIDYTPTAYASGSLATIAGGYESLIECKMLYMSDNTAGPNFQIEAWKCAISPDGALALISEDYANFSIMLALQDDSAGAYGGSAAFPLYKMTYVIK